MVKVYFLLFYLFRKFGNVPSEFWADEKNCRDFLIDIQKENALER